MARLKARLAAFVENALDGRTPPGDPVSGRRHGRSGSRDDPDSRASARVSIQARPAKRPGEKGARLLWTPEIKARAALSEMSEPPG